MRLSDAVRNDVQLGSSGAHAVPVNGNRCRYVSFKVRQILSKEKKTLTCEADISYSNSTNIQPHSKAMVEATSRVVPGAPPPTPISKSHKKKRKGVKGKGSVEPNNHVGVSDTTTASVLDTVPGVSDVKEDVTARDLVATTSVDEAPQSALEDDAGYKPSPVVDLVHKRLKAIHKKIASISPAHKMTCPCVSYFLLNFSQV